MNSRRDISVIQGGSRLRLPQKVSEPAVLLDHTEDAPLAVASLFRRYLLLGIGLTFAGVLFGIALIVLQTPVYKSRILLEVQPLSANVLQNGIDPFAAMFSMDNVNMQTQVKLLEDGPFRGQVFQDMIRMPQPRPPAANGVLSRLRRYVRPGATQRALSVNNALAMAAGSFSAGIINETRLIELSCESTHPVITSEFLNNIAAAAINEAARSRGEASEMTNAWLNKNLDDTRAKLQDADARLRAFVLRSGNVFASDATVDDVKLKELQSQLATAQVEVLAKQAAYETALRSGSSETVPQVVADPVAVTLRGQMAELERQRATLLITLTPKNPKIVALDDQENELRQQLTHESDAVIARLKNEYDGATQHEKLLLRAYAEESGQVSGQASKAADYAAMRREVDEMQKRYDSLLGELGKTQLAQSAPVAALRLVEASQPPAFPSKPNPKTQLLLGVLGGLGATFAIAFIREKTNPGVGSPQALQQLVRVPQLGAIPEVRRAGFLPLRNEKQPVAGRSLLLNSGIEDLEVSADPRLASLTSGELSAAVTDSFRATAASIIRHIGTGGEPRTLLITSCSPGAGKTTLATNLGIALSEAGKRAVLVDVDFRKPRLTKVFGPTSEVRLNKLILETTPVEDYDAVKITLATSFPGLRLLPTEAVGESVAAYIYSNRLPRIFEKLRQSFDVVLVDAPPVLFPSDTRVIAEFCHGAIMVIRADHCVREEIRAAVKCLHEDGVPIVGTVLNGWVPDSSDTRQRYYKYYSTKS